jgi:hypothetical protein
MSDTSAIRAESPKPEKSAEGVRTNRQNLLPPLLIPMREEAKKPAQQISTYENLLLQLRRYEWQEGTGFSDLSVASSQRLITFFNKPSVMVPRAIISDEKLDRELAAWFWLTFPNTVAPSTLNMFAADQLLTLLTNFARDKGSTANRSRAMGALQAVCIRTLEEFQTPTSYRHHNVHPRHYYAIYFTLHHHRNQLAIHSFDGQIGPLSSWDLNEHYVAFSIQPLSGEPITWQFGWQEALDPASNPISFPPLSRREVLRYGPAVRPCTTAEAEPAGTSASEGCVSQSNCRQLRNATVGQSTQDRRNRKAKRRTTLSQVK